MYMYCNYTAVVDWRLEGYIVGGMGKKDVLHLPPRSMEKEKNETCD